MVKQKAFGQFGFSAIELLIVAALAVVLSFVVYRSQAAGKIANLTGTISASTCGIDRPAGSPAQGDTGCGVTINGINVALYAGNIKGTWGQVINAPSGSMIGWQAKVHGRRIDASHVTLEGHKAYYAKFLTAPSAVVQTNGTLTGIATKSPTCAGPQKPGQTCSAPLQADFVANRNVCPTNPAPGQVTCEAIQSTKFSSDPNGHYQVSLQPGQYSVGLADPNAFSKQQFQAAITSGKATTLNMSFDTGIR